MDELINRLGVFFVAMNVLERTGVPFEKFLQLVQDGHWDAGMMSDSTAPYNTRMAFEPREEQLA